MNAEEKSSMGTQGQSTSVLHIVNKWGKGGVERFIEGVAECSCGRSIEHSVLSICTDIESSAPFKAVYGPMSCGKGLVSLFKGSLYLGPFLKSHPFDVVHVHASNGSCFLFAAIAKSEGIPTRIVHSHNSSMQSGSGAVKQVAHRLLRRAFLGNETHRLACSSEAGRHLFADNKFEIIPNGIEIKRFEFNSENRRTLREELGISEDCLMILCIGSLIEAKNHMRSLAIFDSLRKNNPNSRLMILGEGPLREKIEEGVKDREMADLVIMPGFVKDSERWLSAADAVLFPSLHEGLPIALVEAQCNGLPVVCSDAVTREVCLSSECSFLSLQCDDGAWVKKLCSSKRDETGGAARLVASLGFDRMETVERLFELYEAKEGRRG